MDKKVKQTIENMLHRNLVRSDAWIAKQVKGASPEMVRGVRFILERQGKLPQVAYYIDSNGRVWPRDVKNITPPAASTQSQPT